MWSSGWQQWPLQQAMYQNMPHDQVDWAALAKQWIQMQHSPGSVEGLPAPAPPPFPPPPPPPPPSHRVPPLSPLVETSSTLTSTSSISPRSGENTFPVAPMVLEEENAQEKISELSNRPSISMPQTSSSADVLVPSAMVVSSLGDVPSESTFWSNSWDGGPPGGWSNTLAPEKGAPFHFGGTSMHTGNLTAQSYDYNHEPYAPHQQGFVQYWPGQETSFMRKEAQHGMDDSMMLRVDDIQAQFGNLDAAKRKQLPIWIREGLEKMERDRQRQEEKERMKKAYEEKRANQLEALNSSIEKRQEGGKESQNFPIKKSRFDSDSEDEERRRSNANSPSSSSHHARKMSPVKALTEEELMLKVRRMLTEILLEVTNEETLSVSKEVYQRARFKAPAQQLAASSALASITGILGGLAGYGSDDDDEEDGQEEEEDGNGSNKNGSAYEDSDAELERIIYEKKKTFAEKQILIEAAILEAQKIEDEKPDIILNADEKPIVKIPPIVEQQPTPIKSEGKSQPLKPELPEIKPDLNQASAPLKQPTSSSDDDDSSDSVLSSSETDSDENSNKKGFKINGKKRLNAETPSKHRRLSSNKESRSKSFERKGKRREKGRESSVNRNRIKRDEESRVDRRSGKGRSRDRPSPSRGRSSPSRGRPSPSRDRPSPSRDRLSRSRSRDKDKRKGKESSTRNRSRTRKECNKYEEKGISNRKSRSNSRNKDFKSNKSRSSSRDFKKESVKLTSSRSSSKEKRKRNNSKTEREEERNKRRRRRRSSSSYDESSRSGKKSSGKRKT